MVKQNGKTLSCPQCGKTFYRSASRLNKHEAQFCSKPCANRAHADTNTQQLRNAVLLQCSTCGCDVYRSQSQIPAGRVFCSRPCRKLGYDVPCSICGTPMYRPPWQLRQAPRPCCSPKCLAVLRTDPGKSTAANCLQCGEPFSRFISDVERHQQNGSPQAGSFCSKRCFAMHRRSEGWYQRNLPRIPRSNTTIEIALGRELEALGIPFKTQWRLKRWRADFAYPNFRLYVQADGDYFHRLPRNVERDRRFNEMAIAEGWRVIRFWEHEIRADAKDCATKVAELLT